MAEIINLKRARKAKARDEKAAVAELNRAKFGQTKAERLKTAGESALASRRLDGVKRTPDDGGNPPGSAS